MLKKTEDHHAGKLSPKLICKVKSFVDYIFLLYQLFACVSVFLCTSFGCFLFHNDFACIFY